MDGSTYMNSFYKLIYYLKVLQLSWDGFRKSDAGYQLFLLNHSFSENVKFFSSLAFLERPALTKIHPKNTEKHQHMISCILVHCLIAPFYDSNNGKDINPLISHRILTLKKKSFSNLHLYNGKNALYKFDIYFEGIFFQVK